MSDSKTRITKIQAIPREAKGNACLVLIYPPGADMGKQFHLDQDEIVLGRGSDCDLVVDRDSVSRRHAQIYRSGHQWRVKDLDSTNGSYVNDTPVTDYELRDADLVKIGAAIFKFLNGDGVEASYYEEIYRMTIIDGLTGAHNKRYFVEFLEREIARCSRHRRPLSLLMFDIDHFKNINDTRGHLTGDYVLREMCSRLLGRIRKEELMARYGGEEFAVVLPETGHEGAMYFAEQLRQIVANEPFSYDGERFHVTISVGVFTLTGDNMEPLMFIKRVDENLYHAKRTGRNRVVG
jgi:two-component system cell cycle response regulator